MSMLAALSEIEPETFVPVCRQTELFLLSVLMGAGLGVIYDVFRALRAALPPLGRAAPTAVCDVLYLLIFGAAVYFFSLTEARGAVRGYYWLGAFLGAALYLLTAGTVVIGIIRAVSSAFYGILKRLFRAFSRPFMILYRKITTKKGYNFVTNYKKLFPKCKNPENYLKNTPVMVYNNEVNKINKSARQGRMHMHICHKCHHKCHICHKGTTGKGR